ncbi:hypothetical protein Tco_0003524 [Tanacetum coccineum]
MEAQISALQRDVNVLQRQRITDGNRLTSHIQHEHDRFKELICTKETGPQDGPTDAGSSCYSNGDDSHDSRTGGRRQVPTTRECTYSDFLKCQPLNFKGTEGVVGVTTVL